MLHLLLALFIINFAYGNPIVELPLGKIQGTIDTSLNGHSFNSFEGIPYAKPPIGPLRFKEPQPIEPWQDVLTTNTKHKCLQWNHHTPPKADFIVGAEDCLYMNVYTPTLDQNAQLDVIVYIHMGSFMFNYPTFYGPHYLLDKNIVLVSFNYRIGPFGFLSTEDDVLPGNNGLRDQLLALKFVRDNVKYFGGNPNSITIIGLSAGAASVHLHTLSHKSRGLFNRAISMSGCALNPWVMQEAPLEKTKRLAGMVGCVSDNSQQLVDCLRRRSARQIIQTVQHFQPFLYNPFSPFGVVVDGKWSKDPVLSDHPYQLISNGDVADVPWIVSQTNAEGLYPGVDFYQDEYLEAIDKRWDELMPFILDYNYTIDPSQHKAIAQQVRDYYLKNEPVNKSTYRKLIDMIGDRMFVHGLRTSARLQGSTSKSPVYFSYFIHRGKHSHSEDKYGVTLDFGACHGDDTAYVFKTTMDATSDPNDKKLVELYVEMVTAFAKDGKPKVPVEWLPVSKNPKDPLRYLKISSPTQWEMETNDQIGNTEFWDNIPFKENQRLCQQNNQL